MKIQMIARFLTDVPFHIPAQILQKAVTAAKLAAAMSEAMS